MRELSEKYKQQYKEEQEKLYSHLISMRKLKDYSVVDNIAYLKEEYGQLYSSLNELVDSSVTTVIPDLEKIDDQGAFNLLLNGFKNKLEDALTLNLKNTLFIYTLKITNNLETIRDIFEWMYLNRIEEYEFNNLAPELQELYFEAQKLIDKEGQDE